MASQNPSKGHRGKSPQPPKQPPSPAAMNHQPQAGPSEGGSASKDSSGQAQAKKRRHRGGKKRKNRKHTFASQPVPEGTEAQDMAQPHLDLLEVPSEAVARSSFYRIGNANHSNTSLESEALLDHRDNGPLQARRQSIQQGMFMHRGSQPFTRQSPVRHAQDQHLSPHMSRSRMRYSQRYSEDGNGDPDEDDANDHTPLIASEYRHSPSRGHGYGGVSYPSSRAGEMRSGHRTARSSSPLDRRRPPFEQQKSGTSMQLDYDVNNPPSIPPSPTMEADPFEGGVTSDGFHLSDHPTGDMLIDIDRDANNRLTASPQITRGRSGTLHLAADDVCFPQDGMSEIGQEDYIQRTEDSEQRQRRRRRRWPVLSALEEWATEEKEERTMEGVRTRKVSEPLLIGGRLRPAKRVWHREDDDAPYRFTYFNEEFQSTIHSQTISELLQPGQTFKDLFVPEPPILSMDSSDEDSEEEGTMQDDNATERSKTMSPTGPSRLSTRQSSTVDVNVKQPSSEEQSGRATPIPSDLPTPLPKETPIRYGPRPVFWLDVLSPTESEMRVLSKAFGIHPLTAEDIMMQEAREKVELFRHYYFVNYRTFEQDTNSENYMEPVNMYVVVFREGVISFHFSLTPHPANVRRRIRQLRDYLLLSSDWISYAIIDDITDVYAPLIQKIEDDVDAIDDEILGLNDTTIPDDASTTSKLRKSRFGSEKDSITEDNKSEEPAGEMLRRIGTCRKKVMSLYRLLGNKADVIKGFAKRCNEQWEVAPRSEIGLYLGDIQDHIVTMTSNLSHYENLLSRAHGNYLAQINIRMNERSEHTNDVLNKLTVLGTIVLPMNIVTGMWGMNVFVPGQEVESLWWFWGITFGLIMFGMSSFLTAKKVYGIV